MAEAEDAEKIPLLPQEVASFKQKPPFLQESACPNRFFMGSPRKFKSEESLNRNVQGYARTSSSKGIHHKSPWNPGSLTTGGPENKDTTDRSVLRV